MSTEKKMLCCRCRRESPDGKFCRVCGGLLHALPLSGKMPEPFKEPEPAGNSVQQQEQRQAAGSAAFRLVLLICLLLGLLLAAGAFLVK